MMDNKKLAELLFPNIDKTPEYYEEMYPKRNLPEGAKVTRLGPSPTGFIQSFCSITAFSSCICITSTGTSSSLSARMMSSSTGR